MKIKKILMFLFIILTFGLLYLIDFEVKNPLNEFKYEFIKVNNQHRVLKTKIHNSLWNIDDNPVYKKYSLNFVDKDNEIILLNNSIKKDKRDGSNMLKSFIDDDSYIIFDLGNLYIVKNEIKIKINFNYEMSKSKDYFNNKTIQIDYKTDEKIYVYNNLIYIHGIANIGESKRYFIDTFNLNGEIVSSYILEELDNRDNILGSIEKGEYIYLLKSKNDKNLNIQCVNLQGDKIWENNIEISLNYLDYTYKSDIIRMKKIIDDKFFIFADKNLISVNINTGELLQIYKLNNIQFDENPSISLLKMNNEYILLVSKFVNVNNKHEKICKGYSINNKINEVFNINAYILDCEYINNDIFVIEQKAIDDLNQNISMFKNLNIKYLD